MSAAATVARPTRITAGPGDIRLSKLACAATRRLTARLPRLSGAAAQGFRRVVSQRDGEVGLGGFCALEGCCVAGVEWFLVHLAVLLFGVRRRWWLNRLYFGNIIFLNYVVIFKILILQLFSWLFSIFVLKNLLGVHNFDKCQSH